MSNKLKELFSNEKFSEEIRETQKEVKDKIRKATSDNNKLEKVDDILELFSEFKVTDNLDEKEIDFLHSKYKELKSKYDEIKSDQNKNWQFTFPGCGENKDKIDPTSDFVIVNEIMKHMKNEQRNAVFLTTDTTKNDWLNEQKEHYTHYISEFYSNTGKMLFIFDAKNILKMDFENIYKITERNNEQKPDMANNLNKAISNNQLSALEKNVIACIVNSQEQINKSPYTVNINKYLCTIGYNQIEINVAILGLVKKEFIKIWYNEEYEDSNGYYKVLQNAKDWILENQEELFEIVRKQIEAYDMIDRSGEYD